MNKDWREEFTKLYFKWNYSGYYSDLSKSEYEDFIESLLKEERERALVGERCFILNILDGIDIADKEAGVIGGTQAIRLALESRIA